MAGSGTRTLGGNDFLDPPDQALHIVAEIGVGADAVPGSRLANSPASSTCGTDALPTSTDTGMLQDQSGLDLDADKVGRIVDPPRPALPGDRKPRVPDDSNEEITAGDLLGQDLAKIQPCWIPSTSWKTCPAPK